jgi:hypothetical protein
VTPPPPLELEVDEILDSLDLSRAQPGSGFLEALFARFNAKVPFENASKILRDAAVEDPASKPRTPEIFWVDHLELGTGGTCFARVAAFDALLQELGFRTRRVLGRVREPGDHAALLVGTREGESIVDVGFPLPALVPARAGRIETAIGALEVEAGEEGFAIGFEGGVPEGPRSIQIRSATVPGAVYLAHWRQTFRKGAPFLQEVTLRRDLGNRVLGFARGEARVDDLHSRLRVPLPGSRSGALAALFGMDEALLARAFALVGDPALASADTTLTAYLETRAAPETAFSAIATPSGYRRLVEGVAEVSEPRETPGGFRLTLAAGGDSSASLEEDVTVDSPGRRISVARRSGAAEQRSSWQAEVREGRTWLLREATLPGSREDLLRNDSLRGRLAGTLAVDLLAWARML